MFQGLKVTGCESDKFQSLCEIWINWRFLLVDSVVFGYYIHWRLAFLEKLVFIAAESFRQRRSFGVTGF